MDNKMKVTFDGISENERLARMMVAAFMVGANPTVEELTDVKTAVSEAVTNAVIHGYENAPGEVTMSLAMEKNLLTVVVEDFGKGIEDIHKAREPFFTTRPELERSGLGFAFMDTFMDEVEVSSVPGQGTTVTMKKKIKETS